MKIEILDENNIIKRIPEYIKNQEEGIVIGIPKYSSVFLGRNNENVINYDYCEKNNIKILSFGNEGGIIVVNKGDFDIGYFTNKDSNFNKDFAQIVINFLKQKGINVSLIDNDLLIDNCYKCGSFSSRRYGKILYSAFHVSIGMNIELIKNICKKPMKKIPVGLERYGITTKEIQDLFLNFIKSYNK